MKPGPGRFDTYLSKLEEIFLESSKTDNPANYLFENNARTVLFMLEGLSKIYAGLHNKKRFSKLGYRFKVLEDLLGEMDYYHAFALDFKQDPGMPANIREYLEKRKHEAANELNIVLLKAKWINHDPLRFKKIRNKLKEADWMNASNEVAAMHEFYKNETIAVHAFYSSTGNEFHDIEFQVHSLRRKLRWLSIYPQAMQGGIQLSEPSAATGMPSKYMTPEIVNSPFNQLPSAQPGQPVLILNREGFIALSWMISELGKLKDRGLRVIATTEAVQGSEFVVDNIAVHRAFELNHMSDTGLQDIMAKAKMICAEYFGEGNPEALIA